MCPCPRAACGGRLQFDALEQEWLCVACSRSFIRCPRAPRCDGLAPQGGGCLRCGASTAPDRVALRAIGLRAGRGGKRWR